MSRLKKNIIFIILALCVIVMLCYSVLLPYKYYPIIAQASKKYNVSTSKLAAIIRGESNFDPDNVSKKGAVGLMQLMPETATYVGQKFNLPYDDLNNPMQNIMLGAAYLSYLEGKYTGKNEDLIAYNAGEGNLISKRWKKFGETNRYLIKIHLFEFAYHVFYFWR